ncbi:MAG TPA: hypothetical protein PKJ99_17445 [Thermoanaerobaculales bacterium]|nr:hypothetical protein [Thermoanaerobaculales bacterium]HPA80515.1 hypothetical protein [Thermoanaerobaculales bacterium]HQL29550.1 hypothetical protein [Thermoanaerobaculales bacterium]HQN97699.1 hypothetical protein [Thermoanaerobaculales bacterium]HQP43316.1 hypothetical protein [Thermoanaerobaculales bacterium]
MVKRLLLYAVLAGLAFLAWDNRHYLKDLAGLDSNQMRIEGEWYQVSSNIKDLDRYTFNDKMIDRNGEVYGDYSFTGNDTIQATLGSGTGSYTIEFPEPDVMIWYQEVRGTRTVAIRWQR